MTVLSVNLNKVALIRNSRDTTNPSPAEFALMAIEAGAGELRFIRDPISAISEPLIAR